MRRREPEERNSTRELTHLVEQACLVGKDAAANLRDYIETSSSMALLAVKDCEQELDRIERQIDQEITSAITDVSEDEARQLLACLKFIIDLERIGDLCWSVTQRLQNQTEGLGREDGHDLSAMSAVLVKMMERVYTGFVQRDLDSATWLLQSDSEMNHVCRGVFQRHLEKPDRRGREYSTNLLFMAQALERAGDHVTNLGEELFHLVEGRSLRHHRKKSRRVAS